MFTITKKLRDFSAAHRLTKNYFGRCRNLHGHNYALEITLMAEQLNQYDFVLDFDDIKAHFDGWVQKNWDHVTIVSESDLALIEFLIKEEQNYFVIPGNKSTSAESLAEFLFHQFRSILESLNDPRVQLKSVSVFESETACATYWITSIV